MNNEELMLLIKSKMDNIMENLNEENGLFANDTEEKGKYTSRLVKIEESWGVSFFHGILAYLYLHFKDEKYLMFFKKIKPIYKRYLQENADEISHDIGFIYSLYAVALYKLTGDLEAREMALNAADALIKRQHCESGIIQAFCRVDEKMPSVIIDNMMNIQLLMWAHKETGNPFYQKVYSEHIQANTDNLIRDDYTVKHGFLFDYKTGKPLTEKNWCGYSCGSSWARGAAWAIYGYTSAFLHESDNEAFLSTLTGLSTAFIKQLPNDGIPVWDFKLPDTASHMLDTSAAVIAASAFERIGRYIPQDARTGLFKDCEKWSDIIFDTLANKYMADEKAQNILVSGQCGETSRGCIWGDYFFVELLMRKIYGNNVPDFWI